MRRSGTRGFTLLELMIVLVVIAIIVAFALPSLLEQVRKSKRSEAVRVLGEFQLREERWRAENPAYGTLDDLTGSATASTNFNSSLNNYTVSVSGNTGSAYVITATRKNDLATDPKCANFVMRYGSTCDGTATSGVISQCMSDNKNVAYCWRK
ncbi:MAG TPA: type IV pilin protein [Xanthomonadaceae bacterium]|nr:type IV pilin protein [Xanthomonadaceae bacterium]